MKRVFKSVLLLGVCASPAYASDGDVVVGFLGILLVAVVVFLIFREVVCWYWKINLGISLLSEIRSMLSEIQPLLSAIGHHAQTPREYSAVGVKKCPSCAESIKTEAIKCRYCGREFDPDVVAREMQEQVETIMAQLGITGSAEAMITCKNCRAVFDAGNKGKHCGCCGVLLS